MWWGQLYFGSHCIISFIRIIFFEKVGQLRGKYKFSSEYIHMHYEDPYYMCQMKKLQTGLPKVIINLFNIFRVLNIDHSYFLEDSRVRACRSLRQANHYVHLAVWLIQILDRER